MNGKKTTFNFSALLSIITIVCLVSLAGCATAPMQAYPGVPRPSKETATIYTETRHDIAGGVTITHIDGQKVNGYPIHVLPGEHTIQAEYVSHSGAALPNWMGRIGEEHDGVNRTLTFRAAANKDYTVRFALVTETRSGVEYMKRRYWIDDQQSPSTRGVEQKVPLLGETPGIGRLFRVKAVSSEPAASSYVIHKVAEGDTLESIAIIRFARTIRCDLHIADRSRIRSRNPTCI